MFGDVLPPPLGCFFPFSVFLRYEKNPFFSTGCGDNDVAPPSGDGCINGRDCDESFGGCKNGCGDIVTSAADADVASSDPSAVASAGDIDCGDTGAFATSSSADAPVDGDTSAAADDDDGTSADAPVDGDTSAADDDDGSSADAPVDGDGADDDSSDPSAVAASGFPASPVGLDDAPKNEDKNPLKPPDASSPFWGWFFAFPPLAPSDSLPSMGFTDDELLIFRVLLPLKKPNTRDEVVGSDAGGGDEVIAPFSGCGCG